MPESVPSFGEEFDRMRQGEHERRIRRELDRVRLDPDAWSSVTDQQVRDVRRQARRLSAVLPFVSDDVPDEAFIDGSESATMSFIRDARRFDANLTSEDIYQAVRNLWVFNSIQGLLGLPVCFTPSSFAYSLLYPYTDNVLDARPGSVRLKVALMDTIDGWFDGKSCATDDALLRKVSALLEMIEQEFPRRRFPGVLDNLRAIHTAQQKSLFLHHPAEGIDESRLVSLTIEKGGTSVLADGFLVRGDLSEGESEALFGYGVLLQLIDDLRDLSEDIEAGHSTPFSRALASGRLDAATSRLVRFAGECCAILKREERSATGAFHRIIARCSRFMIADAVASYESFYPASFAARIERSCPVRFSFLREMHDRAKDSGRGPGRLERPAESLAAERLA
jgi:hypothetical protein